MGETPVIFHPLHDIQLPSLQFHHHYFWNLVNHISTTWLHSLSLSAAAPQRSPHTRRAGNRWRGKEILLITYTCVFRWSSGKKKSLQTCRMEIGPSWILYWCECLFVCLSVCLSAGRSVLHETNISWPRVPGALFLVHTWVSFVPFGFLLNHESFFVPYFCLIF